MIRTSSLALLLLATCSPSPPGGPLPPEVRVALAGEVELGIQNIFQAWYPRAVDRAYGGFLSQFDHEWVPGDDQQKMVVTQARHTWTTAQAAMWTGDSTYLAVSRHGVAFLQQVMWDAEHGGFYWLVERDGTPVPEPDGRLIKKTYGMAFGIYGLAASYAATGDASALALAQEAFQWLDAHAHDASNGGYFTHVTREGEPLRSGLRRETAKSQNTSLHVIEAFTELYRLWPDPTLRQRIEEMLVLIRDTMRVDPGTLTQYSTEDWTPASYRDSSTSIRVANVYYDHVSAGHDVEAAYLLLDAADVIGMDLAETLEAAQQLVDHSLATGWDEMNAGFVEASYYMVEGEPPVVVNPSKTWWAQAEGLNTLLLMGDLVPEAQDRYYSAFLQMWGYIQGYLVDHEHGGWYSGGLDRQPEARDADKGDIWKGAYHNSRALMNVARRLRASDPRSRIAL
ncbi:MAG: AGE family epimerase/isomerase [Bacteroidota bacterium]